MIISVLSYPRPPSCIQDDELTVYSKVDDDWWYGSFNGLDGLIPDRYIVVRVVGSRDTDSAGSIGGSIDGVSATGRSTDGSLPPPTSRTPDSGMHGSPLQGQKVGSLGGVIF